MNKKYKKIIICLLKVFFLIGMVHLVSAVTFDRIIEYKEVSFKANKISKELDGCKIVLISDTHQSLQGEKLKPLVDKVNSFLPDLVLLGGDFAYASEQIDESMAVLSQIKSKDGIYGVEGNHDIYELLFKAMEDNNIKILDNNGVRINDNLFLGGVEDLVNRQPNIEKALQDAKDDDFVLLLTHNPDVVMLQDTKKADLVLAGHTHGGQITLFGIYAPALSINWVTAYGQKFKSGWATAKSGTAVYVSNGVGTFANIPRVFARPQVIILTLRSN